MQVAMPPPEPSERDYGRVRDLLELGRWIRSGRAREIRERAGVPRAVLADALGVHESTLGRWESGDRKPRPDTALRYRALLVSVRDAQ